jgi:cytochrome oxidase Cu insertion factor (SCO1/SenC/PrrC family)
VKPFLLDRYPVQNADFLAFVRSHADWRRDRVSRSLADDDYLTQWASPTELGPDADPRQPVVRVSWFAAEAYCAARGARLPTEAEWEVAAAASAASADGSDDPAWREQLLAWYSQPSPARLPQVGTTPPNYWGVSDLHGLAWEWVHDFGDAASPGGAGGDRDRAPLGVCGGAAAGAADKEDFPAFMRRALRGSLGPSYTTRNLGFRCAADAPALRSLYSLQLGLTDQAGSKIGLDVFRGRPVLVGMFYGRCPSACPMLVSIIKRVLSGLDGPTGEGVRVLLVSFDAEHDTPGALRAIAAERGLDARWRLASAPDRQARELASQLGVEYTKLPDGNFRHTSTLVLLDRSGGVDVRLEDLGGPLEPFIKRVGAASNVRPR